MNEEDSITEEIVEAYEKWEGVNRAKVQTKFRVRSVIISVVQRVRDIFILVVIYNY